MLPKLLIEVTEGLGVDKLRAQKPVKIGDTIHVDVEVISTRESGKAERGITTLTYEVKNQKGQWNLNAGFVGEGELDLRKDWEYSGELPVADKILVNTLNLRRCISEGKSSWSLC